MSILSPDPERNANDVVPPAALGVILHADPQTRDLLNGKDRFGLPLHATLLERYDMRPELEALARDVAETLNRLLGPKQSRRMMSEAFRQANKGKSDNREENEARLAAYDNEIAAGTPRRKAAKRAAERMLQGRNADVESIAKHIRDLVKDRAKRQAREEKERSRLEAWCERVGPSLLERAAKGHETEL